MKTNNVLVNNLCSWPLGFRRLAGQGDIAIPGKARNFPLLSEEEVLAQIQTGNVMFTGTDGMGNHARIQIVDEAKRKELFGLGDAEVSTPILLNEESVGYSLQSQVQRAAGSYGENRRRKENARGAGV